MVELQSCASLVNASTLCAIEHEGNGENAAVNVIAEISAELQRERQRNAELMERISVLEARLRERDEVSLLASGQASCQIAVEDGKRKRQKVGANIRKIDDVDMTGTDFGIKHTDTSVPVKGKNVENRLVNWMSIDDSESLHSEILKESDSAADCEDTDDSDDEDDEEVGENDICSNHEGKESRKGINRAKEIQEQCPKGDITKETDARFLLSSPRGHDEPKDIPINQECNQFPAEKNLNLTTDPDHDICKCIKHGQEMYMTRGQQEAPKTYISGQESKRVENVFSHKKHPKLAFCPKEVKRILESEELLMKNAQSHTIRKIIVFASLGIRHGCEDVYELDFNHFSILRKGEPYVSPKDPGEHVIYENPGIRRKIFYPNRQNPTLCPVQILDEEKAMRPSDASCPSFLFLCIKYGGRTRNIPQNEYVRQRMGRNKLKSFGPAICRMAMLVHIRSGSFFFKALGITLLFMAGFPDDLVQRETKYRKLDLLQKYYRPDEDAEGEELFRSHSATADTDVSLIPQQPVGKKISTKSKSRNLTKMVRKDQEKPSFPQSAPSKFKQSRIDPIQAQAISPVQYIESQTQANSTIPNPLISSFNCNIPNSSNLESSYPIFPPHPTSSFVPIIYWPPHNAFLPYPHPSSHTYQYPIARNYVSSYPEPYYSNPSCNTLIPKPFKESWKDDAAASVADNDSKSSSSSTEPKKRLKKHTQTMN